MIHPTLKGDIFDTSAGGVLVHGTSAGGALVHVTSAGGVLVHGIFGGDGSVPGGIIQTVVGASVLT